MELVFGTYDTAVRWLRRRGMVEIGFHKWENQTERATVRSRVTRVLMTHIGDEIEKVEFVVDIYNF